MTSFFSILKEGYCDNSQDYARQGKHIKGDRPQKNQTKSRFYTKQKTNPKQIRICLPLAEKEGLGLAFCKAIYGTLKLMPCKNLRSPLKR